MNLLWPWMEPPSHLWIEYRCLEYCYTKLGRWTNFGWWTPHPRCLECQYTNLADWTHRWSLCKQAVSRMAIHTTWQMNLLWPLNLHKLMQEWLFHIATDIWVVKYGNFTLLWHLVFCKLLLLTSTWQFHIATASSCQEWQLADVPRSASRSTPQMHHGMYMMGCIWQPFCILQEKAGISCCFCIIRVITVS